MLRLVKLNEDASTPRRGSGEAFEATGGENEMDVSSQAPELLRLLAQ